jgi:hypothetical protein
MKNEPSCYVMTLSSSELPPSSARCVYAEREIYTSNLAERDREEMDRS